MKRFHWEPDMLDSHAVQPPKSQKVSRTVSTPSTSGYHRLPPSTPTLPGFCCSPKGLRKICSGQRPVLPLLCRRNIFQKNWVVDTAKILHVFFFVIELRLHRLCMTLYIYNISPKNNLVTGQVAENTEKQALQMLERHLDSALKRGQSAQCDQTSKFIIYLYYIHTLLHKLR